MVRARQLLYYSVTLNRRRDGQPALLCAACQMTPVGHLNLKHSGSLEPSVSGSPNLRIAAGICKETDEPNLRQNRITFQKPRGYANKREEMSEQGRPRPCLME